MKVATFMIAAIATIAIGAGSAKAQDDAWHLNYTLNTPSQTAAPYAAATARAQPQATVIAAAANDHTYGMTYPNG